MTKLGETVRTIRYAVTHPGTVVNVIVENALGVKEVEYRPNLHALANPRRSRVLQVRNAPKTENRQKRTGMPPGGVQEADWPVSDLARMREGKPPRAYPEHPDI